MVGYGYVSGKDVCQSKYSSIMPLNGAKKEDGKVKETEDILWGVGVEDGHLKLSCSKSTLSAEAHLPLDDADI